MAELAVDFLLLNETTHQLGHAQITHATTHDGYIPVVAAAASRAADAAFDVAAARGLKPGDAAWDALGDCLERAVESLASELMSLVAGTLLLTASVVDQAVATSTHHRTAEVLRVGLEHIEALGEA